jgi:ATP adenylyltransferase
MDYVWTPWRYQYVASIDKKKDDRCIFCDAVNANDDARTLIAFRGVTNFVILNQYPYTTGHSMVVPYTHVADLAALDPATLAEMMQLAQRLQRAFAATYSPQGYNLGMNLGRCAGAGVADHLHLHVLPRWSGDASFITTVAETRVHPEELSVTYEKLRTALAVAP